MHLRQRYRVVRGGCSLLLVRLAVLLPLAVTFGVL
eukprot:COSAG05_NODE_13654_length_422_cov_0.643963_1_plen_34_part_10